VLFRNVTLVLPDALRPAAWLRVADDGKIVAFGEAGSVPPAPWPDEEIIEGRAGDLLAPGFIDAHVHGALGCDAMSATGDVFKKICRFHAAVGGTTALALTSVAAADGDLFRLLDAARDFRATQTPGEGARLLGVHVEGPFFAATKAGAHRREFLRAPNPATDSRWLARHADVITQLTLAPELPGALALLDALRAQNILASAGHSEATDAELSAAHAQHGLRHVTHLFNAMSSAQRRGAYRVAGLAEWALSEPGVRCELIADGHHVSPTLLRLAHRAKGADNLCLVTDATAGAGLPEGARYSLGALACEVRDGVGFTKNFDGAVALAGSTATMLRCVKNMISLAGVPLVEAVRMATLTPARALGLAHRCGQLAPGLDADLVWLSAELELRATYVRGRRILGEVAAI